MENPSPQSWTSAVRTIVFAMMAVAILLGIVLGQYVPFTQKVEPQKARLLARGGDNMMKAYYLALAKGVAADDAELLLFWANDLYLASLQSEPGDFRTSLSAAIVFRQLGQSQEAQSLLRPVSTTEIDEKTRHVLGAVYALALTPYPALSAVERSREYLTDIGPGPLLTAGGYRFNGKPELADATMKNAATRSRSLIRRLIAALVINGIIVLCGLALPIVAVLRRRHASVERRPFRINPAWGAREAIEAVVLWVFGSVLLGAVAALMVPLSSEPPASLLLGPSMLSALIAIGWVWAVARFNAGFGWDFATGLRRIAIGVGAAGLVVLPVVVGYGVIQRIMGQSPANDPILPLLIIPDTRLAKALLLIAVGVLVPALEETLFRGILFGGLRRQWAFWPAVLIAAVIFAIAHLNLSGFVVYMILGLLFAYLFERSGSVVTAWAAHASFNIFNLMLVLVLFG